MDCLSYFDCLTGLTSKWTAAWLHSKKYIIFIVKIFAPSVFGFKWICYKKWTDRPIKLYWYDKPVQNNQYNLCKMWREQNFSSLRLFFFLCLNFNLQVCWLAWFKTSNQFANQFMYLSFHRQKGATYHEMKWLFLEKTLFYIAYWGTKKIDMISHRTRYVMPKFQPHRYFH